MKDDFYTYAYLREDGSPYYVGKGRGNRCYSKQSRRSCLPPIDKSRVLILKQNLTEEEAFRHEEYMIYILGRKDIGTGILRNLSSGGQGGAHSFTPEQCERISENRRGKGTGPRPQKWRDNISKGHKRRSTEEIEASNALRKQTRKVTCPPKGRKPRILKGRQKSEKMKSILREKTVGMKHWVNERGERLRQRECPGEGWQNGMIWR